MSRVFAIVSVMAILMAGAGLFRLKYQVAKQADQVRGLQISLGRERESVRVLQAEWSHLNSPGYLQDLSHRYQRLRRIFDSQVKTSPADIPFRPKSAGPVSAPNDLVIPVPRMKPERLVDSAVSDGEASGV